MKRYLFILVCLLVFASVSNAECIFRVKFNNNLKQKIEVYLDWATHSFPNHPWPINVAGGELEPNEIWLLQDSYLCGTYIIRWVNGDTTYVHAFDQGPSDDKLRSFTPPETWN